MAPKYRQNEPEVWARLNKFGPGHIFRTRIEARNPPGVSDVYWAEALHCGPRSGWIELKSQDLYVRKEQRLWLRDLRKNKVQAHVLAEMGEKIHLIDPMDIGMDLRIPYEGSLLTLLYDSDRENWAKIWSYITKRA